MAKVLKNAFQSLMIKDAPSYANKLFYSLGFLSMVCFMVLIATGVIMAFYGPDWWLTDTVGKYLRSVHLWATQAFVILVILHLLVVFFTSAFKKPRRLTWVIGVLMMIFVLVEAEFGFVLRGDFSSQWRSLQGADFYNGSGLGYWLNNLSYKQIYGIHLAVIPFLIIGLLFMHYLLVRVLGIAKPYRADVQVKTVPANHKLLFARGGVLIVLILGLAYFLPSPFIKPTTIQEVAQADPALTAKTLVGEFDKSSDTATYQDNIAPYTFDTASVFIYGPYQQLVSANPNFTNRLVVFQSESSDKQAQQLKDAAAFFDSWDGKSALPQNNPAILMVGSLVAMSQAGLYEPALAAANAQAKPSDTSTYVLRFLSDSGVLEDKATGLNLTTDQYGMLHEESGKTLGAWWLAPIGVLNHTVLSNDDNGDRDAAIIFGSFFILLLVFPFVPILNRLPDWLKVYRLIWHQKKL